MKLAIVTKRFRFEAAHHLPGHTGKCARVHGHSYLLEVTLRGPIKDVPGVSDHGMVMDFGDLKQIVQETVISKLDHQDLNVVTGIHTTAENLIHWIWDALASGGLPESLLYRLRLWETESCYAELTTAERR
jgi:6-pyruvoyltetrahydropterin/6-carboxytetrahydropterin synthase